MSSTIAVTPLLLSFLLGMLAGFLTSGSRPLWGSPASANSPPLTKDGLLWLLLFAAITGGVLLTIIVSILF